uniref:Uncharacterized protein n=1 Tax=Rhizophora mucronata TaxID=61149 RepID=A0A2P2PT92_RHIMU
MNHKKIMQFSFSIPGMRKRD